MVDAYVIEIDGQDVGLIVRQHGERAFRFHAAVGALNKLEGNVFSSPAAAERAASLYLGARRL